MKKITTMLLLLAMLLTVSACAQDGNSDISAETVPVQTSVPVQEAAPAHLVNRMTETELARVDKHALTLLDEPVSGIKDIPETHTVSVEFHEIGIDELREYIERDRENMSDADYKDAMENIRVAEENGKTSFPMNPYILVDGYLITCLIPNADPEYDGGEISFTQTVTDPDGGVKSEELSFATFEEYLEWIRQNDTELGYSDALAELDVLYVQLANDAMITGDYETLPEGTVDPEDASLYLWNAETEDYRDVWEYDREEVGAIRDSVDEISIYDEELDVEFLVHVTRPPHYDPDETYPVYFLTDGVWRFGNVPSLYKCMENGEAADVLLVTLGFGYQYDGTDLGLRGNLLVVERYALLDFITNNLMPYLCEQYHIDCENSTIYGHSDGGVFTHTALCKSDLYENQPFGRYIIGSPAFWGLYSDTPGQHPEDYEADYGYFDRNETLEKQVFLCAGALEDPDYADSYNGHDTTLEGMQNLENRLESHHAVFTSKLYDSHHWQYIPDMLTEYLKTQYPLAAE